jgi:apolipoprotein N-acyltransferase
LTPVIRLGAARASVDWIGIFITHFDFNFRVILMSLIMLIVIFVLLLIMVVMLVRWTPWRADCLLTQFILQRQTPVARTVRFRTEGRSIRSEYP